MELLSDMDVTLSRINYYESEKDASHFSSVRSKAHGYGSVIVRLFYRIRRVAAAYVAAPIPVRFRIVG
ncbi:hypothetical protein ACFPYJ_12495 [Paenibacillus solisilvae]|uniref:Uncharacterized protein n=1 Tax=Paenibacillus solisilvae TaxID=2486751 RepID=A0ABW0VWE2_9BACL